MGIDEAIERYAHCIWLRSEWTEITTKAHNFDIEPDPVMGGMRRKETTTITIHTKSGKPYTVEPLGDPFGRLSPPIEMIALNGGTDNGGATLIMFRAIFGNGIADFAVAAGSVHKGYDALGLPPSRKWTPSLALSGLAKEERR